MPVVTHTREHMTIADHYALGVHNSLYQELKQQITTVWSVYRELSSRLYRKYGKHALTLPDELLFSRGYSSTWLSVEGEKWFAVEAEYRSRRSTGRAAEISPKPNGRRAQIPSEFIGASTADCRRLAREILAPLFRECAREAEARWAREARIQQLQDQIAELQAAA